MQQLRVAIVHDWLIGGGAERVVYELHQLFPDAPIYTSCSTPGWRTALNGKVVTGWLQYQPFFKLRKYIPFLRMWWFSRLKFKDFDLVISSSGAEAKGIKVPAGTVHVNYCHAPTHYYWSRYDEYLQHPGFGPFDPLARIGLQLLVGPLRRWDYKAAQRPTYMIANSTYTQEQIQKYYGRDSVVVHPPVDVSRFADAAKASLTKKRRGFVIASRQTPYKRVDLAVAACSSINVPLTVIGNGPDHAKLVAKAGPTITFLTNVTDAQMPMHLSAARAFIFPGIDDFGITPLEAMAAGTPVIAYKVGGAVDYVIDRDTGRFFDEQTVDSLAKIVASFDERALSRESIILKAQEFSPEIFRNNIFALIKTIVLG